MLLFWDDTLVDGGGGGAATDPGGWNGCDWEGNDEAKLNIGGAFAAGISEGATLLGVKEDGWFGRGVYGIGGGGCEILGLYRFGAVERGLLAAGT